MSRKGAPQFASLLKDCVLCAPLSSSNVTNTAKTVTAYGNATQSTAVLDPWGLARPVGYFDGSGDYVAVADSDDFTPVHAGQYTWELMVRFNSFNSGKFETLMYHDGTNALNQLHFRTKADGTGFLLYMYSGGTQYNFADISMTLATNTWYHVVLVKDGTNYKSYINGELKTNSTQSTPIPNFGGVLTFGVYYWNLSNGYDLNGQITEVRLSNVARYTTNFILPTSRFKPDAYTKLLLHMYGSGSAFVDDPFIDVDEFPIIPSGVTVINNGTFTKTALGNNRSVLNFDGSTNYISLTDDATWDLIAGDFTIALWTKIITNTVPSGFFRQYNATSQSFGAYWFEGDNRLILYGEGNGACYFYTSHTPTIDAWVHFVFQKSGTSCLMYINGVSQSVTQSVGFSTSGSISAPFDIGRYWTSYYAKGQLKDLMIWKGRVLTQPEIKLLMNRTNPDPSNGYGAGAGLMPANGDYWRTS